MTKWPTSLEEHNQEAVHLANLGAEGKSKISIEGDKNTVTRKAVRGCWDSHTKGKRMQWLRCRDQSRRKGKLDYNQEIAVPLKVCTAMAGWRTRSD